MGRPNIRYTIDKERRRIITTGEGNLTFDDVKDHQDRLLADPDFDDSFDQLIDATAVTRIDISSERVRVLAERRVLCPKSRRAIVAIEPHIFGFGRMTEMYHEPLGEIHVFHSMHEALKWLEKRQAKTAKS